jgi:spore maturation protein CgeD
MPGISLILTSHDKPSLVKIAIQSVLDQTYQDWEVVLVDSGVLLNQGFFKYISDPRIKIIPSNETPEITRTHNMASWCCNRIINSGRLKGELIMYLCDDDLLYPEAFQTFWDYYLAHQRKPQAMYSSQILEFIDGSGRVTLRGARFADRMAGKFCRGRRLLGEVDYLQFCHSAAILEKFRETYHSTEYLAEAKIHAGDADGVFMEQIGALTPIYPIDKILCVNRRAPSSVNYPPTAYSLFHTWMYFRKEAIMHFMRRALKRNNGTP